MKAPFLLLLLLAAFIPLRADEFIRNGDFSDGLTHWEGDVKTPADVADPSATPLDSTTPAAPQQGLIVKLKTFDWTKATQDFETTGDSLTFTVSLSFSPDLLFSDKPTDYTNVTHGIGFDAWGPITIQPGAFMIMLSDLHAPRGQTGGYFPLKPKPGATTPSTFSATIPHLVSGTEKTITFAFPPGKGMVTLLKVSVVNTP